MIYVVKSLVRHFYSIADGLPNFRAALVLSVDLSFSVHNVKVILPAIAYFSGDLVRS